MPPTLLELLRNHLKRYGIGPGGRYSERLAAGRSTTPNTAKSGNAQPFALTSAQQASPLARCPCDLRRGAVCLWLNVGVPVTVSPPCRPRRVLLRVYVGCIYIQATAANQRIGDAIDDPGSE
jgi:hypothetical protein